MKQIKQTDIFSQWFDKLKDEKGKASIFRRIRRLRFGNFGDCKGVGNGIFELRIFVGPGYRVYFSLFEDEIILLIIGGDKSSQKRDIKKANEILKDIEDEQSNNK